MSHRFAPGPLVLCALLVASCASAEELSRAADELRAKNAADLEALAAWCESKGLSAEAKKTRDALGPHDPYKLYLPVLPTEVGRAELPADAPPDVVEWDKRLGKLERDQANALFDLARRAVRAERLSLALELVLDVIRADPNHEAVRRLLGYQSARGEWHTAYEGTKLRAGQVWHDKFGWLPKGQVQRYEQGQRLAGGRWISAAEDAELHRDIQSGWNVESEHYAIVTDHSLEAGVQLGVKLEQLYRLWQQMFVCYYASEADVAALFDGRARSRRNQPRRYQVVFFRDRDDYNRSLRAAVPNIAGSIGFYYAPTERAYFFAGKDCDDRTLYHEATHQLFQQSRRVAPNVGQKANFWIVEGIALLMESLRQEGEFYTLGGLDDERFYAARYRLLEDKFYVPLAELTTFGMEKLQNHPRVTTLYSQAAGLTHFLVFYDGGRYRDALVAYLAAVYDGRDDAHTLAELTNTPYEKLDEEYRQFIEASVKAETADKK